MRTTLQSLAKVACDGADVGALGATYAEVDFRQLEAGQLEIVNGDAFGGQRCLFSFAGKFVSPFPAEFYGRKQGRYLLNVPDEGAGGFLCHFAGDVRVRILPVDRVLHVETGRGAAHHEGACVLFGLRLDGVYLLGHLADADDEQSRGQRI